MTKSQNQYQQSFIKYKTERPERSRYQNGLKRKSRLYQSSNDFQTLLDSKIITEIMSLHVSAIIQLSLGTSTVLTLAKEREDRHSHLFETFHLHLHRMYQKRC